MRNFTGAVAVVTGAASGIGFACAEEAVRRGMRVVLADVRQQALDGALERLPDAEVAGQVADVTRPDDIVGLARFAEERFGGVNLLVNNAGVFASGVVWQMPADQFEWVVRTNLLSVFHGIRAFVPGMIASGQECHVVNVSSGAGLMTFPGYGSYSTTKQAVLALTETLHHDLRTHGITTVGTTVVMPGAVRTDVMNPGKVAPGALAGGLEQRLEDAVCDATEQLMRASVDDGMAPEEVARQIFVAIEEGTTYLRPNLDGMIGMARDLAERRLTGTTPPAPF